MPGEPPAQVFRAMAQSHTGRGLMLAACMIIISSDGLLIRLLDARGHGRWSSGTPPSWPWRWRSG